MNETNYIKNRDRLKNTEQGPASFEDIQNFNKEIAPVLVEVDNMVETTLRSGSKSKEVLKKGLQVIFGKILPIYLASLGAMALTQESEGSFSEKDRAKREMTAKGITTERLSCYKPGLSELVYRGVYPYTYELTQNLDGFIDRIVEGVEDNENKGPRRYDAWRLYLGLPQKFNTFGISDYSPAQSKDNKYYYKLNNLTHEIPLWNLESVIKQIESHGGSMTWNQGIFTHNPQAAIQDVMRNFTISVNKDDLGTYLSYYDKWDVDIPIESSGTIGEPYEIYDRIYYDPATWQIIDPMAQ